MFIKLVLKYSSSIKKSVICNQTKITDYALYTYRVLSLVAPNVFKEHEPDKANIFDIQHRKTH